MEISDIIERINSLNSGGIRLSEQKKYDEAVNNHREAAELTKLVEINPDYLAVSMVNEAYAMRQRDNDRKKVFSLLEQILDNTKKAFQTKSKSYFGQARILEEMGLVIRYNPLEVDQVADLKNGVEILKESIRFYGQSLENLENEITDKQDINNKLYRTTGIISTLFWELASRSEGEIKDKYLNQAVEYAQQELELRLKDSETKGFGLLNAYHTLGTAQTELIKKYPKRYKKAEQNLMEAVKLTKSLDNFIEFEMVYSVLQFRLAWLEFNVRPENTEKIKNYIDVVIKHQKDDFFSWNTAVKGVLKDKMLILGQHLGEPYPTQIGKMYQTIF